MTVTDNVIFKTDGYKPTHWPQYPPKTKFVSSYIEARSGRFRESVMFGLQSILAKHFEGVQVTPEKVKEAKEFYSDYYKNSTYFNETGWNHLINKHGGHLPLEIKAVPEGMVIPISNVLATSINTDPENTFWLTNYMETVMMQLWYPITIATLSRHIKKIIKKYLEETMDNKELIPLILPWKLHDFGFRGVSSVESAEIGGAAHLVNFQGTDTVAAVLFAKHFYNANTYLFGSIPAAEHSTITSWGEENEEKAIKNMLDKFPNGYVAIVSDSFNIFNVCENMFGGTLKKQVLERNGTVVVRPDCYDAQTEILTENGWVYFKDLKQEKVAQFTENREVEFVNPLSYINQHYTGPMKSFKDKKGRLDLLVTPNHRMVVNNKNKDKLEIKEAQACVFYDKNNLIRAGFKSGEKYNLTPLEKLKIAFQADGSYPSTRYDNNIYVRFNFAKKRKADRLINICKEGQLKYSVHHEKARPQNYSIYVHLDEWPEKTFSWIKLNNISGVWGREFIEELSYWDATRRSENRFKYDTTKKENAEMIAAIAAISNVGCTYSVREDKRSIKFNDVYSLTLLTHKIKIDGQVIRTTDVDYSGNIYCVTVPSGMLVVRRNNKVVISGNSGKIPDVITTILGTLGSKFGFTTNSLGFKTLPPQIRIIQGDGVNDSSIEEILKAMKKYGWSAENITFGMGGALLQKADRDTMGFAMKCSYIETEDGARDVYKDPITDIGKKSKRGKLKLVKDGDSYKTVGISDPGVDIMETVFLNGEITKKYSFDEIRARAEI